VRDKNGFRTGRIDPSRCSLIPSFSLLYILRPAAGSATRYGNVAREA
jgi:hypothetical protein